jgi:hypothetical protein
MGKPVPTEGITVPISMGSTVTVTPSVVVRETVTLKPTEAEAFASMGLEMPVGTITMTGISVPGRGTTLVPFSRGKRGVPVAIGATTTGPVTIGAVPTGNAMLTSVELASTGGITTMTGTSVDPGSAVELASTGGTTTTIGMSVGTGPALLAPETSSEIKSEGTLGSSVGNSSIAVVMEYIGKIDIIPSDSVVGLGRATVKESVAVTASLTMLKMALITSIGVAEAPGVGTIVTVGFPVLPLLLDPPNSFLKKSWTTCHPLEFLKRLTMSSKTFVCGVSVGS